MVGNTRSAPSDDRLRRVELITDRRPLKTILASLKVRLRSALRLSGIRHGHSFLRHERCQSEPFHARRGREDVHEEREQKYFGP